MVDFNSLQIFRRIIDVYTYPNVQKLSTMTALWNYLKFGGIPLPWKRTLAVFLLHVCPHLRVYILNEILKTTLMDPFATGHPRLFLVLPTSKSSKEAMFFRRSLKL